MKTIPYKRMLACVLVFVLGTITSSYAEDCDLVAVGGIKGPDDIQFRGLHFEGSLLTKLTGGDKKIGYNVMAISPSPTREFFAVATQSQIFILACTETSLKQIAMITPLFDGNLINDVSWSPDGAHIAIGATGSHGLPPIEGGPELSRDQIRIIKFDSDTHALSEVTSKSMRSFKSGTLNEARSVTWSPDGTHLAVAGYCSPEILVYSFDGTLLIERANEMHGCPANTVDWTPNGQFIAVGGLPTIDGDIRIFGFDALSSTPLTPITTASHGASVESVSWSSFSNVLAIGGRTSTGESPGFEVRVFLFDGSTLAKEVNADQSHGADIHAIGWAFNSGYLVVAGGTSPSGCEGRIYKYTQDFALLAEYPGARIVHGSTIFAVTSLLVTPPIISVPPKLKPLPVKEQS